MSGAQGGGGGGAAQVRAHSCFIGNINYDATEEQLLDIFREVGDVVSLRLVYDKETGKPKGYGFVEFRDTETALSAIRNLNGREVNGRALRLDVAEGQSAAAMLGPNSGNNSGAGGGAGAGGGNNINNSNSGPARGATGGAGGPSSGGGNRSVNNNAGSLGAPDYMPMQLGGPTPQGSEAHISQFLEGLSQDQLWSMVANMKEQIEQTPEQARQILESNPQLAYALLQAQVLLGMVNTEQLAAALDHAALLPGGGVGGGGVGGGAPVVSAVPMPTLPDPMMQAPMYGGFGAPMQPAYGHPQIAPEHSDLLRQVTALTPNDIAMLPPDQREQVLEIRRQLGI